MVTGVVRPGEVLFWVLVYCGQEKYCGYWCSAARRSIIVGTGLVRPGEVLLWVLVYCGQEKYYFGTGVLRPGELLLVLV